MSKSSTKRQPCPTCDAPEPFLVDRKAGKLAVGDCVVLDDGQARKITALTQAWFELFVTFDDESVLRVNVTADMRAVA